MPKTSNRRVIQLGDFCEGKSDRPPTQRPDANSRYTQISAAAAEIGEVVYAFRTFDDLVKIGHTRNLWRRMSSHGINHEQAHRILFVRPGTRADEAAIHLVMRKYRARGFEYYHPTPEIMEFVNLIRADLGISPVAA